MYNQFDENKEKEKEAIRQNANRHKVKLVSEIAALQATIDANDSSMSDSKM
jgi:hypothetical protein